MKTFFGDSDIRKRERPDYCFGCNIQGYVDGAVVREMTKTEIEKYEKDEVEKWNRINKQEAAARLFRINQGRGMAGLSPFTAQELAAADKVDWEHKLEWQKQETARLAEWEVKKKTMQRGEVQPKGKA